MTTVGLKKTKTKHRKLNVFMLGQRGSDLDAALLPPDYPGVKVP